MSEEFYRGMNQGWCCGEFDQLDVQVEVEGERRLQEPVTNQEENVDEAVEEEDTLEGESTDEIANQDDQTDEV